MIEVIIRVLVDTDDAREAQSTVLREIEGAYNDPTIRMIEVVSATLTTPEN